MLHDPYFITVARKKPSKKVPLVSLCKRKLNAAQHTLAYKLAALHAFGDAIVTEMPLASNNPPKKSLVHEPFASAVNLEGPIGDNSNVQEATSFATPSYTDLIILDYEPFIESGSLAGLVFASLPHQFSYY